MSNKVLKKDGDLVKISGDYHYQASLSKNKVQRFWYFAKKTAIKKYLKPNPNENVLDVGCGSGVISSFLGAFGAKVIGIDGNSEAIRFAKTKFKTDNVDFIHGLVDDEFSFDIQFDKIYCLELIEHIYYWQGLKMLQNFNRYLKPGGKVFITTPNYRSMSPFIEFFMDKFKLSNPMDRYQHVEHYNKRKLENICMQAGFFVKQIKTNWFLAPWIAPISWNSATKIDDFENSISWGGEILIAIIEKKSMTLLIRHIKRCTLFYKYLVIGVVNTIVGYGIIFALMYMSLSPEV
ncbi:MAG: class I SAM-dependent methyltransferase, partial [Bacteroidales bacterium]